MRELTPFNRLAGCIQFAVQIEAESAARVAREGDVGPGFGRDGFRRDDDVVEAAADPDTKPAVVKIGVKRTRTGED